MLEELIADDPTSATLYSDLAAAHLVLAQAADEPLEIFRALAAARLARDLDPVLGPAAFNLGLAQEAVGLWEESATTYGGYVALAEDSSWKAEALRRRRRAMAIAGRDRAAEWRDAEKALAKVAETQESTEKIEEIARTFLPEVRRWLLIEQLETWAEDVLTDSTGSAERRLATLAKVGAAVAAVSGDYLSLDAIRHLQSLADDPTATAELRAAAQGVRQLAAGELHRQSLEMSQAARALAGARERLKTAGSPLVLQADLRLAQIVLLDTESQPYASLPERLGEIQRVARQERYLFLQGFASGLEAHWRLFEGELSKAAALFDSAVEVAGTVAGDEDAEAFLRLRRAGLLRTMGAPELAAEDLLKVLPCRTRLASAVDRHYALGEGAATLAELGLTRPAMALQRKAIAELEAGVAAPGADGPPETSDAIMLAVAYRVLATLLVGSRSPELAGEVSASSLTQLAPETQDELGRALEKGRFLARQLEPSHPKFSKELQARLRATQAGFEVSSAPAAAIEELYSVLAQDSELNLGRFRSRLYDLMASAHLLLDQRQEAKAALRMSIHEIEEEERKTLRGSHESLGRSDLRIAFGARLRAPYHRLIELLVEEGRTEEAFELADRHRAVDLVSLIESRTPPPLCRLLDSTTPTSAQVLAALPADTAVIETVWLEEQLLVWTLAGGELRFNAFPLRRSRFAPWIASPARLVEQTQSDHRPHLTELYDALLGKEMPFLDEAGVHRLVFVVDEPLVSLPIHALPGPEGQRSILERYLIAMAPSARFYARALERDCAREPAQAGSALLVAHSGDGSEGLVDLPYSLPEVEQIARAAYPERSVLLVQEQATPSRLVQEAPAHDVVHFAGHTAVNLRLPSASYLLLQETPDRSGRLHARELAEGGPFSKTRLFVFSSCSAASGRRLGATGASELVRAVFANGPTAVVASVWPSGDPDAAALMPRFHRYFSAGLDAAAALRCAQLEMAQSRDSEIYAERLPSWAPFRVYGFASSPFSSDEPIDPRRCSP